MKVSDTKLNAMTLLELVVLYNKHAAKSVKSFKSKAMAIARIKALPEPAAETAASAPTALSPVGQVIDESMTMAELVAAYNNAASKLKTVTPVKSFKSKAIAIARIKALFAASATPSPTAEKEPKKVAKAAGKAAAKADTPVPAAGVKIALIATAEEVKELQAIRDLRIAGKAYKTQKTSWFKKFRAKYGITTSARIKVETENGDKLGLTQFCSNNATIQYDPSTVKA